MLNEEATIEDVEVLEKNPAIQKALQQIFGSIEKKALEVTDDVQSEGLGDVLKSAFDPDKNPILKMANKSKLISGIMAVLGMATEEVPHEITLQSMIKGLGDPKPDALEFISDYIDPSNLETIMQLAQQMVMEETLEDQIAEAVMDLLDEVPDKFKNKDQDLFDPRVKGEKSDSSDAAARVLGQSGDEEVAAYDRTKTNAKEALVNVLVAVKNKSIQKISDELKAKPEAMKNFLAAIKELGGVEQIPTALELGPDGVKLFTDLIAALKVEKSPNKEIDKMKVSMQKINKLIEDRKDIFFAVEGSFAQVRKMAFVPKPVEGQEPVAFLSGEQSVNLSELGVDPKNLKGDLGSVIVVRSKDLYNIRKLQKEAPEDNVVDIVPINNQQELDNMFSGTKLNDQGGPLEGSGLFFVKNDSEEMAPVGAAQDQTSELDISKAQEKYGKTLEGVFDGEELTLIIKFLALLMKDDLLNENLRDVLKGIGLGRGKIATAIKAGQESGVFTQDEIKKVSAIFKDNPEKTKKFIAAITQTSKPQDKEKTEPETGASKKEDAVKVDGLVDALDVFMGTPPGAKPNFYYPQTNLLKEQGEMLLKLYSKIRILLDLPTIEFHRALLAYNDLNTGPEQEKEEPVQAPPPPEPAQAETPPPGKRDDLYEAKDISAKEVEPKNLVILRDYIQEAITTVQIYMQVAKEGQRGSKELYSKYGNIIGTAAYEPKKVLYQINLKNIVNLCNSFLTRLDSEMKKSTGEDPDKLEEAKTVPFAEIVQQVKTVFDFVTTEGTQLKKMIIDHAEKAQPAEQNEAEDPAQTVRKENPQPDGKDVTRVKPSVDAIRKSGQEIHDQLKSIQQHFPLVNPFDSEEYGTQGFENAITALKNALGDVANVAGQVAKTPSFGEVSTVAKKALYDVLERIVKTIKDTFAGQFSERPAANEETSEEEFTQDEPSVSTEPTDIEVGNEPEVSDEPSDVDELTLDQAMTQENLKPQIQRLMRNAEELLEKHYFFYELVLDIFQAQTEDGALSRNQLKNTVDAALSGSQGEAKKNQGVVDVNSRDQKQADIERDKKEKRIVDTLKTATAFLQQGPSKLTQQQIPWALPQAQSGKSTLGEADSEEAGGLSSNVDQKETEENRDLMRSKMLEFLSTYQILRLLATPEKVLEFKKEGFDSIEGLLTKQINLLSRSAKTLQDMIKNKRDTLEMIASAKKDQEGEVSAEDLKFREQINKYQNKINLLEKLKELMNAAQDEQDFISKVNNYIDGSWSEEINENLDQMRQSSFELIDAILQKFYAVQEKPSEKGFDEFVQIFNALKERLKAAGAYTEPEPDGERIFRQSIVEFVKSAAEGNINKDQFREQYFILVDNPIAQEYIKTKLKSTADAYKSQYDSIVDKWSRDTYEFDNKFLGKKLSSLGQMNKETKNDFLKAFHDLHQTTDTESDDSDSAEIEDAVVSAIKDNPDTIENIKNAPPEQKEQELENSTLDLVNVVANELNLKDDDPEVNDKVEKELKAKTGIETQEEPSTDTEKRGNVSKKAARNEFKKLKKKYKSVNIEKVTKVLRSLLADQGILLEYFSKNELVDKLVKAGAVDQDDASAFASDLIQWLNDHGAKMSPPWQLKLDDPDSDSSAAIPPEAKKKMKLKVQQTQKENPEMNDQEVEEEVEDEVLTDKKSYNIEDMSGEQIKAAIDQMFQDIERGAEGGDEPPPFPSDIDSMNLEQIKEFVVTKDTEDIDEQVLASIAKNLQSSADKGDLWIGRKIPGQYQPEIYPIITFEYTEEAKNSEIKAFSVFHTLEDDDQEELEVIGTSRDDQDSGLFSYKNIKDLYRTKEEATKAAQPPEKEYIDDYEYVDDDDDYSFAEALVNKLKPIIQEIM